MEQQWLAWAQQLQAIAQAGLEYSKDKFDLERFAHLRKISIEIMDSYTGLGTEKVTQLFANESGYQTPKVDIRAVVPDGNRLLLVREQDDNRWALPGGWADIHLSVKENAEKEVREESGMVVDAERLVAILDRNRYTDDDYPYSVYKIFVSCRVTGGAFKANNETSDARYFDEADLPELSLLRNTRDQVAMCYAHIRGDTREVIFD